MSTNPASFQPTKFKVICDLGGSAKYGRDYKPMITVEDATDRGIVFGDQPSGSPLWVAETHSSVSGLGTTPEEARQDLVDNLRSLIAQLSEMKVPTLESR
jgi:hypothetical protein